MQYPQLTELRLSDSSYERYRSCERKLEFAKFYGHARGEHDDTIHTGAGHAIHAAWQTYITNGDRDAALWALMSVYPMHLQRSEMEGKSIQSCYWAFLAMLDNPINARYTLAYVKVNGVERPAVEVPFRIVFKGFSILENRYVPVYWEGFIDVILWDTLESKYIVVDIKSTGKFKADYATMFARDPQCLPYAYVLKQALQETTPGLDVLYFVVLVNGNTPQAMQYTFKKTEAEISAWAFTVAKDLRDMKQFASLGYFPRRGKHCDTFGPCKYTQVCGYSNPDAIRQWLDLYFRDTKTDNPLLNKEPWFELSLEIEGL